MDAVVVHAENQAALVAFGHDLLHRGVVQRLLGGAVGNHFHGPEHALAANLADLRVLVVQSGELRAEHVLADGVGVVDDVLLFHGFLGGHDGAHGQRVTGVGQAAGEDDVVEAVGHPGRS